MRMNVIALLLSVALAAGNMGTVPVMAAETAVQSNASGENAEDMTEEGSTDDQADEADAEGKTVQEEQEEPERQENTDVGQTGVNASEEELVHETMEETENGSEENSADNENTGEQDVESNIFYEGVEEADLEKTDGTDTGNEKSADQFAGSVRFDTDIICNVNEQCMVTADVLLPAGTNVENPEWSCSDEDALIFSGTSSMDPITTGTNNLYWVSVMIHANKAGEYNVTLTVNNTLSGVVKISIGEDLRIGVLKAYSGETVTIDSSVYPAATNCVADYDQNYLNKEVFYSVKDGEVKCVRLTTEVIVPEITLVSNPDSFVYENGEYNENSHTLYVNLRCCISRNCPFPTESVRRIAEGKEISVYKYNLEIKSDYLNFGKTGTIFKKSIESINSNDMTLALGRSNVDTYPINVKDGFVPTEVNNTVQIEGSVTLKDGTVYEDKEYLNLYIVNLDLQKKAAEDAKRESSKSSAAKKARQSLDQCTAISLDAELLPYLTIQQTEEIEDYLTVYMAKVMTAEKVEDSSIFDKISDRIREKVKNKILSKLHISKKTLLVSETIKGSTSVSCITKDGQKIYIYFSISLDQNTLGERDPYGSFAAISYETKIGDKKIEGIGEAALVNMKSFADSMLDFLKIAYDESWGKGANEIAAMFDAKPIDLLLDGDYSGKMYELCVDATKASVTKEVHIHCPVDVSVYDSSGELCAQITDNRVVQSNELVAVSVNGDEKIIYYSNDDFYISLSGTDAGTMNYTVIEMEDGSAVRHYEQENIPLQKGLDYEAILPSMKGIDSDAYAICDDSGEIIGDVSDDVEEDSNYSVSIGIHYTLEDNKLILFGDGSTGDYEHDDPAWNEYKDQITEVVIQPGITELGDGCFYKFANLKNVELSPNITRIGRWAFLGCENLEQIELPDSITKIEKSAFYGCKKLSIENLPAELESIGDYAFSNTGISTLWIGEKVESIGFSAFWNDTLNEVHLCCKDINAHTRCFNIDRPLRVIIEQSVENLNEDTDGDDAIFGLGRMDPDANVELTVSEDNEYYSSLDNVLFNKEKSKLVFYANQKDRTKYIVPDSVTSIANSAFYCTGSLTEIEFPINLESIGDYAFYGCDALKELIIPDTVSSIGKGMVMYDDALVRVKLPQNLLSIPSEAFFQCGSLNDVNIPDSVEDIGDSAFWGTDICPEQFSTNLKSIGSEAFSNTAYEQDKTIIIPDNVENIGTNAFTRFGITRIIFKGDAPSFSEGFIDENNRLIMTKMFIYYPINNETWDDSVLALFKNCDACKDDVILCGYGDEGIIKQEKFEVSNKVYNICEGESISIDPKIIPDNATNQYVVYEPEIYGWDSVIELSDDGKITGLAEGEVSIRIKTAEGGYSEIITVNVTKNKIDPEDPTPLEGTWKKDGKGWWYQRSNKTYPVNTFETIDGKVYYFDGSGYMVTGWKKVDETWYYFESSGVMKTGWLQDGSTWYYFDDNGEMVTGEKAIGGKTYYFKDSGGMITGWLQQGDDWYYLDGNGNKISGWKQLGSTWYYFDSAKDGLMATGFKDIKKVRYYFDASGAMKTGWQKIKGTWYYFESSGAMKKGWLQDGSVWYYFDNSGKMVTGEKAIGGKTYYFKDSGGMITGWLQQGNDWYYLDSNGNKISEWKKLGSTWYYFDADEDGLMVTGLKEIGGKLYYFDENGAMKTGWQKVDGDWYYFNAGGDAVKGWLQLGKTWYYFTEDGKMVTGTREINGKTYTFDSSGAMK